MKWLAIFRRSGRKRTIDKPLRLALPSPDGGTPAAPDPTPTQAPPPSGPTPDDIRRVLFDAVARRDEQRLESLCQEHKDFILEHGARWLDVPPSFRASPEAHQWYSNGLRAVARFCADRLGWAELLRRLDNPAATPPQP